MTIIYTLLGVPYVAVLDPVRGIVLQKAARKRIPSPGQMSLFAGNEPKEGDTKVENGITYRLNQHSRWERTDKAKGTAKAKPKAVVPVVEEKREKPTPEALPEPKEESRPVETKAEPDLNNQQAIKVVEAKDHNPHGTPIRSIQMEIMGKLHNFTVSPYESIEKNVNVFREDYRKVLASEFRRAAEQEKTLNLRGIHLKGFGGPKGQHLEDLQLSEDLKGLIDSDRIELRYQGRTKPIKSTAYAPDKIAFGGELFALKSKEATILAHALGLPSWNDIIQQVEYSLSKNAPEPTPVAAEVVVDEPKPKQRLGDRMRAIAQELRQETEAQKQYTARMLGAAAQLAQNQDNLIDEVVDMVNEDLDTPEALPEPTPEPMLGQAGLTKIPPSVASKLRASFGTVKAWNQRVDLARQTDRQFQGGGRYTWEAINGTQMEEPETIQLFREMAPKNGVDADAALAAMGYEPPTQLMPSEMNEPNVTQRNATPEALPEPTIGDMLAEQKAEEEPTMESTTPPSRRTNPIYAATYPYSHFLPGLKGSKKQKEWALVIREDALRTLWSQGFHGTTESFEQDVANLPNDASWWIDNRDGIGQVINNRLGLAYSSPAGSDY